MSFALHLAENLSAAPPLRKVTGVWAGGVGALPIGPQVVLPKPGMPVTTAMPPSKKTVGAPRTAQAFPPVCPVRMSFCVPASLPCTAATFDLVLIDFLLSILVSSQPGSRLLVEPMMGEG